MEAYGNSEKLAECIVQNSMEQDRRMWNTLETTVSYKARARLTPTLTHVVTYELVTSGAEDRAMSLALAVPPALILGPPTPVSVWVSACLREREREWVGLPVGPKVCVCYITIWH